MEQTPEAVRPTRLMKKMVGVAGLLIIAIGLVYYIIDARALVIIPFTLGVAVTTFLNIFKLHLLERTVQKVVLMDDQGTGKNIVRFQYLLRFMLTGIVLVVIGLIDNFTAVPPFYMPDRSHFPFWATLFPNAPESLLSAPVISMWGALAGIFTLQISVIIIRTLKLEKDGDNFIEYVDDEEANDKETADTQCNDDDNNENTNTLVEDVTKAVEKKED